MPVHNRFEKNVETKKKGLNFAGKIRRPLYEIPPGGGVRFGSVSYLNAPAKVLRERLRRTFAGGLLPPSGGVRGRQRGGDTGFQISLEGRVTPH